MGKTLSTKLMLDDQCLVVDTTAPQTFQYRAPEGHLFDIKSITFVPISVGANYLAVFDSQLREDVTTWVIGGKTEGLISAHACQVQTSFQDIIDGYKCKFLSLMYHTTTAVRMLVFVRYKLIPATEDLLIYEYVKNARVR